MTKLVYQHKKTGEKIQLRKNAERMYILSTPDGDVSLSRNELKEYRFIRSESVFTQFNVMCIGGRCRTNRKIV